jgi:hypothetical protein
MLSFSARPGGILQMSEWELLIALVLAAASFLLGFFGGLALVAYGFTWAKHNARREPQ